MKREEFFKQLRGGMSGFPSQTIESTISYYDELIDDAIEDGKSEETIIESFGSGTGLFKAHTSTGNINITII